jgi:hypothetical protein
LGLSRRTFGEMAIRLLAALGLAVSLIVLAPAASGSSTKVRGPFLLVSLPSLGTMTWRCDPARGPGYALGFRAFPISAEDLLRLHIGRRTIVTRGILPGHGIRLPYLRSRVQQVNLVQGTEAGTLRAFVTVDFVPHGNVYCYPYFPPKTTVRVLPRS